ncbi:GNAT family N-acetyltransferase [Spiroplasma sp. BIUS-1]|uniref:GNAT family N-acetyltransferase n=1 Tax=Spiroplasma sp. BIUS-1 TaxID=216964 RepID=UPI001398943B|nr:GNAT family N-acetyltransferase [Spiroplasma sp. BIUS-1]QHX36524.1 hypothetical protein SBIUS_v1c02710 [Spiroplasma sp. BIUS-1]
MKFRYNESVSKNKKYDIVSKHYINYYTDPTNIELESRKVDNFEILSYKNHSNLIITKEWDYKFENYDVIMENKIRNIINFTEHKYDGREISNKLKFKDSYKFMALNLSEIDKFKNHDLEEVELVRFKTKEELEKFIEIVNSVFLEEFSDAKKFYGIFDEYKDFSELYLLRYKGEFVGTGHLTHFDNKTTVIDDITVLDSVRGKGLATFLMKSLLNICFERNQEEVYLFGSEMAINIYKKLGFKDEDFWMEQLKLVY